MGAELPARSPGCKLGAAPSRLSLSVSLARGSPESTPTSGGVPSHPGWAHLLSSPPQSLPAGSCPWPGPRRPARPEPEPGRCPFSVCGAWPAAGARQGGQPETPSARRWVTKPSIQSPAARAAALLSPPGRRQLTARPQRTLKAKQAGGATVCPGERPGHRGVFPESPFSRGLLPCQLQHLGAARQSARPCL